MSRETATAAEILQSEVAHLTKQLSSTQDHLLQVGFIFLLFPLVCYLLQGWRNLPANS
jgi:predicted Na+-dependent transporter